MKANIDYEINTKIDNDGGVLLSIGMIVKNEEKVIRRCLQSLKPLMSAVSCELIIADTGSTDNTMEIAREFTDNVFHFDWINDFAAARNSTLERAKGQWFMFIDADEYFDDDIGEMVHFFGIPELRSKYKTLEIMVRSYTNPEKTDYRDGCLARFHRIDDPDDPVHFVGKIHEGIWIRQPLGYFSTIIHHTGYCFVSENQNFDKKKRNLELMREEYKENPNDLRMVSHLIDGSSYDDDEREQYVLKALELVRSDRRHLYANVAYMQIIGHYQDSKPDYAINLCDEYINTLSDSDKYVATVAIYILKARILSAQAKYELAYVAFKNYFRIYNDYKDGKLNLTDASAHPIEAITESEYNRYCFMFAILLKKMKKYEEAFIVLSVFDVLKLDGQEFREFLGTVRELCKSMKDYSKLADYYYKVSMLQSKDKRALGLYMMESTYYSLVGDESRMSFANDMVRSGYKGDYFTLMSLITKQNEEDFLNELQEFISGIDEWTDGCAEVIYLAIKYGIDMGVAVEKMKASHIREIIETVAINHDDFAGYVLDYGIPEEYFSSIKKFFWITSLYEKASYRSFILNNNDKLEIYRRFTALLGDYVLNIYNPELFNDEKDVEILPELHKFGYFMKKANDSLSRNDSILYIRYMKKALISCESMKEIIQFLLDEFKKGNITDI